MIPRSKIGVFLVVLVVSILGGVLTYLKFNAASATGFTIEPENRSYGYGVLDNGFIIMYPDELTYILWMEQRSGSLQIFIDGEANLNLNLYGYLVGWLYDLVNFEWQYLFILGVLGFLCLIISSIKLLKSLGFTKNTVATGLVLLCLSPAVINLSSGLLRDLFVISLMNWSLAALIDRKYGYFLFFTIIMTTLRSFMPIIIFPIYAYFFFDRPLKLLKVTAVFLISLVALLAGLTQVGSYYDTSVVDVFFRLVSGVFGLNIVVLRWDQLFESPGVAVLEKLSHIYHFLIMCGLYFAIAKSSFRIHSFYLPFLYSAILLSILYGVYLGYFVGRTKLVLLWLAIIYICFHIERVKNKNKVIETRELLVNSKLK